MDGIGLGFDGQRRAWAASVALLAVGMDFRLAHESLTLRALPAAVAFLSLLFMARFRGASLGLSLRPVPSWHRWLIFSGVAAGCIAMVGAVYFVIRPDDWHTLAVMGLLARHELPARLFYSCIQAPPLEEGLYRVVLCSGLVGLIGETATVVVSGLIFAALHFVYGSAGPDNAIAGFFLAWAFLRSRSVVVPLLMHAGGNFLAHAVQLAATWVTFGPHG